MGSGSEVLRRARANLAPWLGQRAQFLVARSTEVHQAELGTEKFDAVFVDAMHTEESAKQDIITWSPRIRAGGLLAGHDYSFGYRGVVEAAHALIPRGATLHLAPNNVFWWRTPNS